MLDASLPFCSRMNVVPFKMCWKTEVPINVMKNESSKHSVLNKLFTDFSQPSVAFWNDSGKMLSNSVPILFAWSKTPDARRPMSAGMKMMKAAGRIWSNVTPHPLNSTRASNHTSTDSSMTDCASPLA